MLHSLNYLIPTKHQLLFPISIISYQAMSSNSSHSFMGIASIPKLKGKSNYEEWRNAKQGFCKMNGYILGQILQPTPPQAKEATPVTSAIQEAFDTNLMKWLTITDSLRRAI